MEPLEGNMAGASEPDPVSTRQQRIAELAKQSPEMGFTSLAHYFDLKWLWRAFQQTRKDGAVGVDGQTAEDFLNDLKANLESLRSAPCPARTERRRCGGCTFRKGPVLRHGLYSLA
jgi:hypothetical protein